MLALTQETLDLGYRIRVPATPRTRAVTRPIETGEGERSYTLSIKQQDDEVILTAARGKDRWELTRFPSGGKGTACLPVDDQLAPFSGRTVDGDRCRRF